MRNCTRDEGGPFGFGNQVLISSHRKLLLSKAVVVSVKVTPIQAGGLHAAQGLLRSARLSLQAEPSGRTSGHQAINVVASRRAVNER